MNRLDKQLPDLNGGRQKAGTPVVALLCLVFLFVSSNGVACLPAFLPAPSDVSAHRPMSALGASHAVIS